MQLQESLQEGGRGTWNFSRGEVHATEIRVMGQGHEECRHGKESLLEPPAGTSPAGTLTLAP